MAFFDTTWYVNFGDGATTGYYAVAKRPQNTAVVAGQIVRQFTAPAVGNERVFVCIVAGTTANTTDATWVLTRGAKTTDGTATWIECTGLAGVSGDAVNTPTWATAKTTGNPSLGALIKRNNGASYQICSTGGTIGASEPSFSDTAGVVTNEVSAAAQWTCLGPVGNFTGGQAPHARLANALASTWFASGNTVYVGDNHAETQATAVSISPSSALMAKILCHSASGSYPPTSLTTGATVTSTLAGGAGVLFFPQGSFYVYGITFKAGNGTGSNGQVTIGVSAVGQVQNWYYFDNCSFWVVDASTGTAGLLIGNAGSGSWNTVIFDNTTVKFAGVAERIGLAFAHFTWKNTGQILASGSAVPNFLIGSQLVGTGGNLNTVVLEALDLSQLTGSIFSNAAGSSIGNVTVKDCKLNASATVIQPINTGQVVQLSRSDSAATAYKSSRSTYEGIESTETSIVRTGGYADPTGQVQSRKILTSANAQWLRPYKGQAMAVWNGTTGSSKTVTVYGTVNAGALPNNDDIWMEVSYLADGSFPKGSTATSGKAQVWSANAAVPSDGSSWSNIPAYSTLDGVPESAVAMSNGNLTATHGNTANGGVQSLAFLSTGKYYFEIALSVASNQNNSVGITRRNGALTTDVVASGTNCVVAYGNNPIFVDGVSSGFTVSGVNFAVGDVYGVAVDLTNRLIWFRKNSAIWNNNASYNPVTGVGGVSIPTGSWAPFVFFASGATANCAFAANFGQSSYANAAPSGFGNWYGWSPFKLSTTITPQLPGYIVPVIKAAKASTTFYIDPLAVVT